MSRQRIEVIDDFHDLAEQADVPLPEISRIAAHVVPDVMLEGDLDRPVGKPPQAGELDEAFGPIRGMFLDDGPLRVVEDGRLVQDFARDVGLAHIMEERGDSELGEVAAAKAEPPAEGEGQDADIDRMVQGVFVVVLDVHQPVDERFVDDEVVEHRLDPAPGEVEVRHFAAALEDLLEMVDSEQEHVDRVLVFIFHPLRRGERGRRGYAGDARLEFARKIGQTCPRLGRYVSPGTG